MHWPARRRATQPAALRGLKQRPAGGVASRGDAVDEVVVVGGTHLVARASEVDPPCLFLLVPVGDGDEVLGHVPRAALEREEVLTGDAHHLAPLVADACHGRVARLVREWRRSYATREQASGARSIFSGSGLTRRRGCRAPTSAQTSLPIMRTLCLRPSPRQVLQPAPAKPAAFAAPSTF